MAPSGPIRTIAPWGGSFGIDWSAITQWTDEAGDAATEFGVPIERTLATIAIESAGNPDAVQENNTNGWSYGLMQIVPYGVGWDGWWRRVGELSGLPGRLFSTDINRIILDPALNIRVGCSILRDLHRQHGSWDKASSAFFLGNPHWRGQDTVNGNTGAAYRASLNGLMEEYLADSTPAWSPVIYDLARDVDASRFGLTASERDRILAKNGGTRRADQIQAVQLHVQWGNTPGSLRHWLGVSASSTIMVQRDGSILKVIPELRVPWTGGDVKNPDTQARDLFNRFGWDPNQYSLTIEAEDERTEDINDAQLKTIVWQIQQWAVRYPNLADEGEALIARLLAHFQINSVDKINCGKYKPKVVAALRSTTPAPAPPPVAEFAGLPAWCPPDYLKTVFPNADPNGAVTKRLIRWIAENNRLPWLVEKRVVEGGSNRNIWAFDIVNILNDGNRVWVEGETL